MKETRRIIYITLGSFLPDIGSNRHICSVVPDYSFLVTYLLVLYP